MKAFIYLFLFFFIGVSASADTGDDCFQSLSDLINSHSITRNLNQPKKYKEHEQAGRLLKYGDESSLDEGAYIYIINKNGDVFFTARYFQNHDTKNLLATHGSLFNKLILEQGDGEVIAAGEFYIKGGVVSEFNNKSGKFRAGEAQLFMAKDIFKKYNFEIDPSVLRNYANSDEVVMNHSSEEALARYFEKIMSSDDLRIKFETLQQQYQLLYHKFQGQRVGEIDNKKVRNLLMKLYGDDIDEGLDATFQVIYFITYTFKDQGGLIYSFYNLHRSNKLDIVLHNNSLLIDAPFSSN